MTTPRPVRKDIALTNKVVELTTQRYPNDFEVRRCESGVRRLLELPGPDTDAARCYVVLGLLRVIRSDGKGALDAIRNARRLKPADSGTVINLLAALQNLGEIREAGSLADEWRNRATGDPHLLSALCTAYKSAYRAEDSLQILAELSALKPASRSADSALLQKALARSIEARAIEGYSRQDMQDRLRFAIDVMREEGLAYLLRHCHWILQDGSSAHTFFVDASLERCAALDWLIIDRVVERFERAGGEVMSFRCLPVDAYFDMCGHAAENEVAL